MLCCQDYLVLIVYAPCIRIFLLVTNGAVSRARVQMWLDLMWSPKHGNVGKSQSVLIMNDPVISARTLTTIMPGHRMPKRTCRGNTVHSPARPKPACSAQRD
jgi:hypothetical protein